MNEYKRTYWESIATKHANLRYPKISVQLTDPFNSQEIGLIRFRTFVPSMDKEKLTLVEDDYQYGIHADVFNALEAFKKRFIAQCEQVKKYYIFNKETSIREPFKINKIK